MSRYDALLRRLKRGESLDLAGALTDAGPVVLRESLETLADNRERATPDSPSDRGAPPRPVR